MVSDFKSSEGFVLNGPNALSDNNPTQYMGE